MSNLKFEVDIEEITKNFEDLKTQLTKELTEAVGGLASMTHAKTLELARDKLKSLAQMYQENVEFSNPMENFWIVTLKEPALWIEDGRKSGFMQELLDGKSAKTNKKGEKYAIIPFKHNQNPTRQSPQAKMLAEQIKKEMKSRGIYWKKIENDASGSPRIGKIHSFNISSGRLKETHKTEPLRGVAVYQTRDKNNNVRKDVLTFRIIHEKHRNEGLWIHPGRAGDKIMDEAFDWAMKEWENSVLPAVLEKYGE